MLSREKMVWRAVIFLFFFFVVDAVHGAQDQKITMRELANEIPSSTWNTSNSNPCEWKGVVCSSSRITHLLLSGLGLSTSSSPRFFPLLCELGSLQSLDLSSNLFTSIPMSFFSCNGFSELKYLNLSWNGLAGPLSDLSAFAALETLDLSFNSLEGAVGSKLNQLAQLKSLNLSFNFLIGSVPALKANCLEELALSNNSFHGRVPDELVTFVNLTFLDLSRNMLNGSVPAEIGNLSMLEILHLSSNSLVGEIPVGLSKMKRLSIFSANQNKFNGSVPPGITSHMQFFDLSYNHLNGWIPPNLLAPSTLHTVDLTANYFEGPIPRKLSKNMYRLRLGENSLNGSIPAEIGQLLNLTYLELNNNQLEGEIPQQLANCKRLTLLNLAVNKLQGGLPEGLGSLKQLVIMKLQRNRLSGEIPAQFLNLTNLSTLDLSGNSLSGAIPSATSTLSNLQILNLENNEITGSIPGSLSALTSIIELRLANNKLGGMIPRMPLSLSLALDLRSNLLSGPIPSQLGALFQLEILDLSNNNLTGEVPNSFVNLQGLIELVLSNNRLLSGSLPALNPKTIIRFSGTGIKQLTTAQGNVHRKSKSNTVVIVIVVIIGAVAGFVLLAAFVGLMVSKRFCRIEDEFRQSDENSPPQIVNGDFITSDSIHKTSIDFAKALELAGNPSNAVLKTRFSSYYKVAMPNGRNYTVKKLYWRDKIFQMVSHEKLGQELEVLGRLSNSNVLVPLAYVFTEDSAYLFYEHIHEGTVFDFLHKGSESSLDWPSRYSIALGVAQGLTFLHSCSPPILLLDLSTKSILLKSMKEPQIGDIELCKIIDPFKSTGSLSTVAGSVGYIPPEYAYTMRVTMAGNVYSFGVVLLELLTGKPPISKGLELAKWAQSYSSHDGREKILDPSVSMASLAIRSQMLCVLKIALSCVSSTQEARPKMRNVLRMLFNAR